VKLNIKHFFRFALPGYDRNPPHKMCMFIPYSTYTKPFFASIKLTLSYSMNDSDVEENCFVQQMFKLITVSIDRCSTTWDIFLYVWYW